MSEQLSAHVDPSERRAIVLTIPDEFWQPIGYNPGDPEEDRLVCTLYIGGAGHHLEAGRAWVNPENNCVEFRNEAMEEEIMTGLQRVYDGAYELATIRGQQYIVYMTPFAD